MMDSEYKEIQRILCEKNHIVPKEIWPSALQEEVWWDYTQAYEPTRDANQQALAEFQADNPHQPL